MKKPGLDSRGNFIHDEARVDDSVEMGHGNYFGRNVTVGPGCKFGHGNLLLEDVIVGPDCTFRSRAELRSGTLIEHGCYIDSGVKSSGDCHIREHVTLRYDSIIARGCVIGERAYVSPRIMFENLSHEMEPVGGAHVGSGCWIGTQSVIGAGISIVSGTVIGSCSLVKKSIEQPGVYFGIPAKFARELHRVEEGD